MYLNKIFIDMDAIQVILKFKILSSQNSLAVADLVGCKPNDDEYTTGTHARVKTKPELL